MPKRTYQLLLSSAIVLTVYGTAVGIEKPAKQAIEGKIDWVFDYAVGKKLSQETGKPMFVVFRCER